MQKYEGSQRCAQLDNCRETMAYPKGVEIVGLDLPLFESSLGEIKDVLKKMRDQGRNHIANMKESKALQERMQHLAPLAYKTDSKLFCDGEL